MRVSFLVLRLGCLRTLAPLVLAAREIPGLEIEILVPPTLSEESTKSYQQISPGRIPKELSEFQWRFVASFSELRDSLELSSALFSIGGPSYAYVQMSTGCADLPPLNDFLELRNACPWIMVYDTADSCHPSVDALNASLCIWPSKFWLEDAISRHSSDAEPILRGNARFTGYVRSDIFCIYTPTQVKEALRLPPDKPVVLFVPDNYTMKNDRSFVTPWFHYLWMASGRWRRFYRALRYLKSPAEAILALFTGADADAIPTATRVFCDNNDAQLLLVPRRRKDSPGPSRITRMERGVADKILDESEGFPQSIMLGLLVADLVVFGYPGGGSLDAGARGVPFITVMTPPKAFSPWVRARNFELVRIFTMSHVHWVMSAHNFVRDFAKMRISDFRPAPSNVDAFKDKLVGACDGSAARKTLEAAFDFIAAR